MRNQLIGSYTVAFNIMSPLRWTLLVFLLILLMACGGGGGGSRNTPSLVISDSFTPRETIAPIPSNASLPTIVSDINATQWRNTGYTGAGIKVAVLDTGWETSAELSNTKIHSNQTYTNTLIASGDTTTKHATANHGQYMATIIGGQSYGIAPGVDLFNGYIGNGVDGNTTNIHIAGAMNWAVNIMKSEIVSISYSPNILAKLTSTSYSSQLRTSYNQGYEGLNQLDRLVIAAAGNDGNISVTSEISSYETGGYTHLVNDVTTKDNILIMGALGNDDLKASYSAIAGSNVNVQDRMLFTQGDALGSATVTISGTSTSAAITSGLSALMHQRWSHLGGSQISQILIDTANRSFLGYNKSVYGMGIVDANRAFSAVGSTTTGTSQVAAASVPTQSMALTLPAGVSANAALSFAGFDSYGRDFIFHAKIQQQPVSLIAEGVNALVATNRSDRNGSMLNQLSSQLTSDTKLSGSLILQSSWMTKGQALVANTGFLGLANLASQTGLDHLYATGIKQAISANHDIRYGLMHGERQTLSGIEESIGAYWGYKNQRASLSFYALDNPHSLTGYSLLASDRVSLIGMDANYLHDGLIVGGQWSQLRGTGSQMLEAFSLNSQTIYAGVQTSLTPVWSLAMLAVDRQQGGTLDLTLPVGRNLVGDILLSNSRVGLTGSEQFVSANLSAEFGQRSFAAQAIYGELTQGILFAVRQGF